MSSRRNRWGMIFLIGAFVGFAFFWFQPWWPEEVVRYFRAFFEAALVGALADWFAVTALFKRPLGIPLPHTDILVRRKDQLVEALPRFLGGFLEPDRLYPVLRSVDWAGVLLDRWGPDALDELFGKGVAALEGSPARETWERGLVALGADLVYKQLGQYKDSLVGPVTDLVKRSAGWKGLFVSRDNIDEIISAVLDEVKTVRDKPESSLAKTLAAALHTGWPRIAEQLKPSRWTADVWRKLDQDPAFRETFNRRAGEISVALWEKAGASNAITHSLGFLLGQTDARALADRIEAAVGNDLQYIRVNGAIVGGLAGLALQGIKDLVR